MTVRTIREREAARRLCLARRTRFATLSSAWRQWNSTWARIVNVTPVGGGANLNVQPAWRRSYRAGPAYTQGDTPLPATGAQASRERLQYSARKRMNMRWPDALPGIPARTPMELGAPSVSQMLTVAQSRGVLAALAMPYDGSEVTGCASDTAMSGTSAAGSCASALAGPCSAHAHASMATAARGRDIQTSIGRRRAALELVTESRVMNWTHVRSKGVTEAVADRIPVRAGAEAESFAQLYERAFPRVYAYVASLLRDRAAAEDVTAQAFERAYSKRGSYRARRGSPEAWLFGIARNAALDELRRRKRGAGLESEPADRASPTAEDHAELAMRREVVRAALAALDGHERDLISLKFSGGLSNAEIARVLGLSETNAGTRLHRALTKLRKACDDAS
jgi:RNA polymerase sigma-70 factor, ECF subfamily